MELVDPTYPGLSLSFVISVQASRQPYSPEGAQSDLMSVLLPASLVLNVSQAPPTPRHIGGGAGMLESNQGKRRLQRPHTQLLSPKENAWSVSTMKAGVKCNCSSVIYVGNVLL